MMVSVCYGWWWCGIFLEDFFEGLGGFESRGVVGVVI